MSERQWGTVREDYSPDGTAWDYFPHDHARSRSYRWGEDGLAGISDDQQLLCLGLALWNEPGSGERHLLSLLRGHRMKLLLKRMLDEAEFLSTFGVRSLSRIHAVHPYSFNWDGQLMTVRYEPGESQTGMFGGNSNWRGPIWFPVNFLIIESLEKLAQNGRGVKRATQRAGEFLCRMAARIRALCALQKFRDYYGDDFQVECPTGSGKFITLKEVAAEVSHRLMRLFVLEENGFRPSDRHNPQLSSGQHFSEHLNFYEYFDGDTGRGLGASHQTGWTGLVANLIDQSCR